MSPWAGILHLWQYFIDSFKHLWYEFQMCFTTLINAHVQFSLILSQFRLCSSWVNIVLNFVLALLSTTAKTILDTGKQQQLTATLQSHMGNRQSWLYYFSWHTFNLAAVIVSKYPYQLFLVSTRKKLPRILLGTSTVFAYTVLKKK